MSTIKDLLQSAIEKKPLEFSEIFEQILDEKCQDILEAKHIMLAQGIYESEDIDEEDEIDEELDLDDEDLEFDDIDLDDLDLDDLDDDFEDDDTDQDDDSIEEGKRAYESDEDDGPKFSSKSARASRFASKMLKKSKKYGRDNLDEDVDQIDELSKNTLTSYIKKAGRNAAIHDDNADFSDSIAKRAKSPKLHNDAMDRATYNRVKSNKRVAGIVKAASKLAKEELEVSNDE